MSTYSGWPREVAPRSMVPPERSLQVELADGSEVRHFLATHSQARQVLCVTMANAQPHTVKTVAHALRAAGSDQAGA
jgi:hypothetical protein